MSHAPVEKSLWRHADFARYWSACAVDIAGSGVTTVALPLIAVVSLHATVREVSLLSFAERLPPLLVTLPAGALADRHRKRPLMIGAVIACGAAFTAVPLADTAGCLSLELLYAVGPAGAGTRAAGPLAAFPLETASMPDRVITPVCSYRSIAGSQGARLFSERQAGACTGGRGERWGRSFRS
ncbi:MFS transporter [Streptomyces abikoensis]|uniref:MFS transporter n=1 Tax=Streptomyces abikoensis TaxID=97398 RepID=UPI0034023EF6